MDSLLGEEAPGSRRLLMLPKDGFNEDALASFAGDPRFSLFALERAYAKAVYPAFLPTTVDDNNYRSAGHQFDEPKARLRAFWMQAWPHIQSRARVAAVLTGNFGYHAEQELAAAVAASGVPFIAMHKEAMKTPGRQEWYERIYRERRQPFAGTRVLAYNRLERDIQVNAGSITPDRITICGMPRLDRLHAWRRAAAAGKARAGDGRPRVVMFSFHPKTGLPMISRKDRAPGAARMEQIEGDLGDLAWTEVWAGFHETAVRLARENPDIEVVIKAKENLPKWLHLTSGQKLEFPTLPNLRVVVGGDPHDLIASASVVCGFISTALLECLAAGKHVVVPRFGETRDPRVQAYLLDLGTAVEYVGSTDALYDALRSGARRDPKPAAELSAEAIRQLDHWGGNSDGQSGARVAEAVQREITAVARAA